MDYLNENISINLRKIRRRKQMSLDDVAVETGISKSMLGQIERGEANPTVGTLGVWRYRGEGPKFVKLGGKREHRKRDTRRVAYPVREVIAWGEQNGLQQQTVAA